MFNRRMFLSSSILAGSYYTVPGLFADQLTLTPNQTDGPFYPDKLPLDTDNDLIIINDKITPAVGQITHIAGKILDANGSPIKNAVVEIWQCDNNGAYLHSKTSNKVKQDSNFQGFGRFATSSSGEYYFRTIKPVAYPGRTPHIHFKIKVAGKALLSTQCYVKGEPKNDKDGIYQSVKNDKQRQSITVDFAPIPGSKLKELSANFNLVLGYTPDMP